MLAVLITLTPGRRNEFIDRQKAKVKIAVLPIMNVTTQWNSTLELLERHQQKTSSSGRNGSVRVDALRQSRQRHPGGGLLSARRQYHASRCISPSDHSFAVSSRSVGLLF